MRVFVTGGTGLVGRPLVEALLQRGDEVVLLTRDVEKSRKKFPAADASPGKLEFFEGDPTSGGAWQDALGTCDGVVHLVGEPVMAKRWTAAQKKVVRDSRVDSTRQVVEAIRRAATPPRVLVSTSAVGYYGDCKDSAVSEQTAPGKDFLATVCRDWEAAAEGLDSEQTRTVVIRVGIVLAPDGGALQQMLPPFRWGAGAILGAGFQYMSWIHRSDLVRMYLRALDDPNARGPWNGTAPAPVTNVQFSHALAKAIWRPCLFFVPSVLLRLLYGEAANVLLTGQRALPNAARTNGFEFEYETLPVALAEIFTGKKPEKPVAKTAE